MTNETSSEHDTLQQVEQPALPSSDDLDALRAELEQLEQVPLADRPAWFSQVHQRLVTALRAVEEA